MRILKSIKKYKIVQIICIALLFLVIACSGQPPRNEKLYSALEDMSIPTRGKIIDIPKGEYRYDYYDFDEESSSAKELGENGYQGGGPSWKGIVYGAILLSDSKLLDKIRFDEEADGLAIWSHDRKSLEKIGRLISVIKSDKTVFRECITIAEKNGQME